MVHELRRLRAAVFLAAALALASCGGGGSKLMAITQLNAADIASAGLGAADFVREMAHLVDELVDVIETGPSGSQPCPGGGTQDTTINDVAPLGEISAGDFVSIRFTNCVIDVLGDSYTVSGVIEFRITSASYPSVDAYDIALTASFRNLSLAAGGATIRINGGFNLQLDTPDGIVYTTTATGSSLKVSFQFGTAVSDGSVSNFVYGEVYDDSDGDYSLTGHGRVYESTLGGAFDSEVTVPLDGTDPDYPGTGRFLMSGSSNSSVLLFVLDDANVELRVDEDGDGIVDIVVPTTWVDLVG